MKRRSFLQNASLISLAPSVPAFLPRANAGLNRKDNNGKILVVLQLSGGNDGLNTVIPFADERYAKHRPKLKIANDRVIKVNDSIGLHPQLKPMAELLDDGRLSIVQGVGYPNPNRSHFESMDIWHTARLKKGDRTGHGWLGRMIDANRKPAEDTSPDAVFVGDSEIPVALRGRRANSISLNSENELRLFASVAQPKTSSSDDDLTSFIRQTVDSSYIAAKQFAENAPVAGDSSYPNSRLGRKLQLLSRMIKLGGSTQIFYVSQGGYDTHSDQLGRHDNLLRELSRGVAAFMEDMQNSKLADRVLMLSFSEFGRRVTENASVGTDHGTAGPVFVAGPVSNPGLIGSHPSLDDLDQGDLKMTTDFRSIYANVLSKWLHTDGLPDLPQVIGETAVL